MNEINDYTYYLNRVLAFMPHRISSAVNEAVCNLPGIINEIRLVRYADASITAGDKTFEIGVNVSDSDIRMIFRSLCGNSVYSHSETIREGFIVTGDGIRVGVSGNAVTDSGKIVSVTDINSLIIRIPSRHPGMADELYGIMKADSFRHGVLVYSPPSGGKTSLLRELTVMLSKNEPMKRVAVVDTRYEIGEGIRGCNYSSLNGYPRSKGMEIAVRTMSCDVIICDEISTESDLSAVTEAYGAGVCIVASCHGNEKEIFQRQLVRKAMAQRLFGIYYGLDRRGEHVSGHITYAKDMHS